MDTQMTSTPSTLPSVSLFANRAALSSQISDKYIKTDRDDRFRQDLQDFVDETHAAAAGQHPEGRMLAVIGTSGAGKTWTIEKAVPRITGLDSGNFLRLTAPSPCTLKQLGRTILESLGYPLIRDLPDHIIWEKVRRHVKERGVRFIWLDEAHHTMGRGSDFELTRLRDTFKSIMQQRDWPLSLILSGLPVLSSFICGDRQVERRSQTFRFAPLAFPHDAVLVQDIIHGIVVNHASMVAGSEIQTDEFAHRLIVASERGLGSAIVLVRRAILAAYSRAGSGAMVGMADFGQAYVDERDCSPEDNIFLVSDWDRIVPSVSRLDAAPLQASSRKRRGAK
ncbi:hypothetical protein IP70_19830 [alpha proteobacterium AAP38]|nr:hypothetical protein IP70_19830 [alpha proteobacterium AAP38]